MSDSNINADTTRLDASASLETVLTAWHAATLRLEQTHEALREEVKYLTDELESKNRELARKNRLADLGQMASHVAHEVRNNLVPITLYMSLLRRRLSRDPGSLSIVDKITAGFTGLDASVNDLLHFTADRDPHRGLFFLADLAEEIFDGLMPQLEAQGVELDLDMPDYLRVWADREMIRRALLNLTLNAIDAMPNGGNLTITATEGREFVELEIADSGPGLSSESMHHAFDPFFSTKPNGTGLGLAIVSRIVESHGGKATAANCPEGGAAFTLFLPRATALEAAA